MIKLTKHNMKGETMKTKLSRQIIFTTSVLSVLAATGTVAGNLFTLQETISGTVNGQSISGTGTTIYDRSTFPTLMTNDISVTGLPWWLGPGGWDDICWDCWGWGTNGAIGLGDAMGSAFSLVRTNVVLDANNNQLGFFVVNVNVSSLSSTSALATINVQGNYAGATNFVNPDLANDGFTMVLHQSGPTGITGTYVQPMRLTDGNTLVNVVNNWWTYSTAGGPGLPFDEVEYVQANSVTWNGTSLHATGSGYYDKAPAARNSLFTVVQNISGTINGTNFTGSGSMIYNTATEPTSMTDDTTYWGLPWWLDWRIHDCICFQGALGTNGAISLASALGPFFSLSRTNVILNGNNLQLGLIAVIMKWQLVSSNFAVANITVQGNYTGPTNLVNPDPANSGFTMLLHQSGPSSIVSSYVQPIRLTDGTALVNMVNNLWTYPSVGGPGLPFDEVEHGQINTVSWNGTNLLFAGTGYYDKAPASGNSSLFTLQETISGTVNGTNFTGSGTTVYDRSGAPSSMTNGISYTGLPGWLWLDPRFIDCRCMGCWGYNGIYEDLGDVLGSIWHQGWLDTVTDTNNTQWGLITGAMDVQLVSSNLAVANINLQGNYWGPTDIIPGGAQGSSFSMLLHQSAATTIVGNYDQYLYRTNGGVLVNAVSNTWSYPTGGGPGLPTDELLNVSVSQLTWDGTNSSFIAAGKYGPAPAPSSTLFTLQENITGTVNGTNFTGSGSTVYDLSGAPTSMTNNISYTGLPGWIWLDPRILDCRCMGCWCTLTNSILEDLSHAFGSAWHQGWGDTVLDANNVQWGLLTGTMDVQVVSSNLAVADINVQGNYWGPTDIIPGGTTGSSFTMQLHQSGPTTIVGNYDQYLYRTNGSVLVNVVSNTWNSSGGGGMGMSADELLNVNVSTLTWDGKNSSFIATANYSPAPAVSSALFTLQENITGTVNSQNFTGTGATIYDRSLYPTPMTNNITYTGLPPWLWLDPRFIDCRCMGCWAWATNGIYEDLADILGPQFSQTWTDSIIGVSNVMGVFTGSMSVQVVSSNLAIATINVQGNYTGPTDIIPGGAAGSSFAMQLHQSGSTTIVGNYNQYVSRSSGGVLLNVVSNTWSSTGGGLGLATDEMLHVGVNTLTWDGTNSSFTGTAYYGNAPAATNQTTMPIYLVGSSGATPAQASLLASDLGLNPSAVSVINGEVSFIDPTNWMRVPMQPVTDATVLSNLSAGTVNQYPTIPLSVQRLDFVTLTNLNQTVIDTNSAMGATTFALGDAGLTPEFGSPTAGFTTLILNYTNANGVLVSNSFPLDTQVSYVFSTGTGSGAFPLCGPGAQVQVTYQPATGLPTRLFYAARQLQSVSSVLLISSNAAASQAAAQYYAGMNAQITPRLVYYCPPLSATNVWAIIPHYQCTATVTVTNPDNSVSTMDLLPAMFPATTDPTVVPSAGLTASGGTQVVASVVATGGLPPYTYTWGGSFAKNTTNAGPSIAYTPIVRAGAAPDLQVVFTDGTHVPNNSFVFTWDDPAGTYLLQWVTNLAQTTWNPDTHPVTSSNGWSSVTISSPSPKTMFFRLCLASLVTNTETVTVTVTDANGVSAQTSQNLLVQAVPVVANGPDPAITYGCESPYDAGLGTTDRRDWQNGMGRAGAGGGVQQFCWMGNAAWPGDFIEPKVPGITAANTPITGDADCNGSWGINTADIVFYVGHGAPWGISFTYPAYPAVEPVSILWDAFDASWLAPNKPAVTTHWEDPARHDWYAEGHAGFTANLVYPSPGSWRTGAAWPNDTLDWLCLLSCEVMSNAPAPTAWQHWGPNFNGLHVMTGFRTDAWPATGFPQTFANNLLGVGRPQLEVVSAWFNAAAIRQNRPDGTGRAAAMGPLKLVGTNWISNENDYYWGKGPVGPNLYPPFQGWWYLAQP